MDVIDVIGCGCGYCLWIFLLLKKSATGVLDVVGK